MLVKLQCLLGQPGSGVLSSVPSEWGGISALPGIPEP